MLLENQRFDFFYRKVLNKELLLNKYDKVILVTIFVY